VYGAAGPDAFDCSGFTLYVYAQLGISLPHSSAAQVAYTDRVSDPEPGDLVFFTGSGGVYHVAIYAGDGMIWEAPHTGTVVSLAPIWSSSVFYGRVR
jgi:cell wall-associated NlpC family hydrolase